jgi:thiamine monophosphate synthase
MMSHQIIAEKVCSLDHTMVSCQMKTLVTILCYLPTVLGYLFSWKRLSPLANRRSFTARYMGRDKYTTKGIEGPYIAIITELTACDTPEDVDTTVRTFKEAISTELIYLIVIRVRKITDNLQDDEMTGRVQDLIRRISNLRRKDDTHRFHIVVTSDWISAVDPSTMDVGIHFKESHRHQIPIIHKKYMENSSQLFYGTSAHSIASAWDAVMTVDYPPPNYLLVGTCYPTESHPEKDCANLEGPALPGQVVHKLTHHPFDTTHLNHKSPQAEESSLQTIKIPIVVLAIGGIDETNCRETIQLGANGVAVIRAVMRATDPAEAVRKIYQTMIGSEEDNEDRVCI